MKHFLSILVLFLSFGSGFVTNAAGTSPNTITLPKFKCPIEVTLYAIYEPDAGPNRAVDAINPMLYEWATKGALIGERARITDSRTDEDGTKVLTRATTIRTGGGISLTLTNAFLEKIIRYNVEDSTLQTVFIYWEPGMTTPVRDVRQPNCR